VIGGSNIPRTKHWLGLYSFITFCAWIICPWPQVCLSHIFSFAIQILNFLYGILKNLNVCSISAGCKNCIIQYHKIWLLLCLVVMNWARILEFRNSVFGWTRKRGLEFDSNSARSACNCSLSTRRFRPQASEFPKNPRTALLARSPLEFICFVSLLRQVSGGGWDW
jgi:hypothetical protein